jgi:hypothetical protein
MQMNKAFSILFFKMKLKDLEIYLKYPIFATK